ncbi:MAG: ABC transporter ATP-binding protein, partial [Firmicutes bacterium]|nr:ABC transporter ATP-binding protein [Bacillota bacterium]
MLELRHVSRYYRIGKTPVKALSDVSVIFPAQSFSVVLGPSGSGKSTLLNLLGGLDQASSGTVLFNGQDIARLTPDELAGFRRHHVSTVFQSYYLLPHLSALENVELALSMDGGPQRHLRAAALLEQVGLQHRLHNTSQELSGGEQQRVAIARALAHRPDILLADEPTGNLDPASRQDVMDLLHDLHRQGYCVIVITHNEELIRPQDRVVRLADGQVVSDTLRTDRTRSDGAFSGTASITPARTTPGWSFWMARRNILRAKARTM